MVVAISVAIGAVIKDLGMLPVLVLIAFGLGAGFALMNIYFSAICTLSHRLREGHWPPVVPMGIPMVGTLLLLSVIVFAEGGGWMPMAAALLALLDTGGPLFMLAFVRYRRQRRLQQEALRGQVR